MLLHHWHVRPRRNLYLNGTRRVSDLGALTSLNITGTDGIIIGVITHTVDVTAAATLTSVTIAGKFDSATVSGTGVTSLSTAGYITDLQSTVLV